MPLMLTLDKLAHPFGFLVINFEYSLNRTKIFQITQPLFICSKSAIETLEKGVK